MFTSPACASENNSMPLHDLSLHQWALVEELSDTSTKAAMETGDAGMLLRLAEIGFVPGERVCIVAAGMPGYEPLAVRIGRSTFALRRREAALVHVVPLRNHLVVQKSATNP